MVSESSVPHYLDPEHLAGIARLDLRARQIVEGYISGMHRSPFRGQSVEFAEHRAYAPGDDIRHMDWKLWARSDRHCVKQYEEETNLRCTLIIDCSASMAYGRDLPGLGKFDYACTLGMVMGHLLQRQQDAVGLITFDNKLRDILPPRTGRRHLQRMADCLQQSTFGGESEITGLFPGLVRQLERPGLAILLSDLFVDEDALATGLALLRHAGHDVAVFQILHHHETTFPFEDATLFEGMESRQTVETDPGGIRHAYLSALEQDRQRLCRLTAGLRADFRSLSTNDRIDGAINEYLAWRHRIGLGRTR